AENQSMNSWNKTQIMTSSTRSSRGPGAGRLGVHPPPLPKASDRVSPKTPPLRPERRQKTSRIPGSTVSVYPNESCDNHIPIIRRGRLIVAFEPRPYLFPRWNGRTRKNRTYRRSVLAKETFPCVAVNSTL